MRCQAFLFGAVSIVVAAVGCGISPDDARKELTAIGVQFTPQGFTQAAGNGDLRAIELFILAGVEIDTEISDGLGNKITALEEAVYSEHVEVIRVLLDAGADPTLGVSGAISDRNVELTALLLDAGADGIAVARQIMRRPISARGVQINTLVEAWKGRGFEENRDALLDVVESAECSGLFIIACRRKQAEISNALRSED